MNILDKIIAYKKREVALKKSMIPISQLERYLLFEKKTHSLVQQLKNSNSGIIAEHKRRSPSKSVINNNHFVEDVVLGYQNAGVCGISILTDTLFFGGCLEDLILAKSVTNIPLLRKEFIIDTYQIIEAKANGADAILLIAAVLSHNEIKKLATLAQSLALEVVLEVHNLEELEKSIMPCLNIVGVNNRNLKTFEVNLDFSKALASKIPSNFIKISESGIDSVEAVLDLKNYGYNGFLMGEHFMKTNNPGEAVIEFVQKINSYE